MSQLGLLADEPRTAPPPEERRSRFDVDCTPSPVASMVVEAATRGWLRPGPDGDAPRVLDLAAGAGSWSRAVRQRFPRAIITALEIRAEERPYLERWCDRVVIGDATDIVWRAGPQPILDPMERVLIAHADDDAKCDEQREACMRRIRMIEAGPGDDMIGDDYDLVVGNPPFSLQDERKAWRLNKKTKEWMPGKSRRRAFEVFVGAMRPRLSAARRSKLVLYVPAAWWQRGEDVARLAKASPPCQQMNVPLPISHRGRGQQAATDAYAAYAWPHPSFEHGCSWSCYDLDILPAEDRRWVVMPGSEEDIAETQKPLDDRHAPATEENGP